MIIKSSFKDYYDNVQAYGFDPKLVYVRESDSFEVLRESQDPRQKICEPLISIHNKMPRRPSSDFDSGVIAFCGKAYPFYSFADGKCYFSYEKLYKAVLHRGSLNEQTINWLKGKKELGYVRWTRWGSPDLTKESWDRFKQFSFDIKDEFFISMKAPLVMIYEKFNGTYIQTNPRLYETNFSSVIDPFTAHQTLAMFVGNNMASQMDPNPKISDVLKRDSAGFDEWSFKTHKTESKKYKKKNR